MAQGRHEEIRRLFKEAMAGDPSAVSPATAYHAALAVKWGGTDGEQDGFAEHFARMYSANYANRIIQAEQLSGQADRAGNSGNHIPMRAMRFLI